MTPPKFKIGDRIVHRDNGVKSTVTDKDDKNYALEYSYIAPNVPQTQKKFSFDYIDNFYVLDKQYHRKKVLDEILSHN